jgi:hypothetical protein
VAAASHMHVIAPSPYRTFTNPHQADTDCDRRTFMYIDTDDHNLGDHDCSVNEMAPAYRDADSEERR